jgi:hypothetical protein
MNPDASSTRAASLFDPLLVVAPVDEDITPDHQRFSEDCPA